MLFFEARLVFHWSKGLVVKALDSQSDSAFHPPKVDKMTTRNFWELSGKK